MELRNIPGSELRISALSFGTATFGGAEGGFFKNWGTTDLAEAKRLVSICLDAGINAFDTANIYSHGRAETLLGQAIKGHRSRIVLSTKATLPMGTGVDDAGSSRQALKSACEASLRRLNVDHIDLYYMHSFDATTPVSETLEALDDLIRSGKVRYIGCSNFSGWHLMKSLCVSERQHWARYVAHQAYYSLAARELEWELMPLGADQDVATIAWSALSAGALTGKYGRNLPPPPGSRMAEADFLAGSRSDRTYDTIEAMDSIVAETGRTHSQIAINWVLQRPTVSSVVLGARDEAQLRDNLGSVGWSLGDEHMARLSAASQTRATYPYWHQQGFPGLIPPLVRSDAATADQASAPRWEAPPSHPATRPAGTEP